MKFTSSIFVSLAIAVSSYGISTPRDSSATPCSGAKPVSVENIQVSPGKTVELTTFSCDAPASSLQALDTTDPTPVDVCAELCETECANSGSLPPTSDDCETIVNAITILNGSVSPSFGVDAFHAQTLAFGTCRFFFENLSNGPESYCWLSLAQVASAAGSACLPPVQPVNSEGLCLSPDGLWRVGVAHS